MSKLERMRMKTLLMDMSLWMRLNCQKF